MPARRAAWRTTSQITFGVMPDPHTRPTLLIARKTHPSFIPLTSSHFIHRGFHPARNGHCPKYVQPFPPDPQSPNALLEPVSSRSPIRATHRGLKPQPINNANIAKSRFPRKSIHLRGLQKPFPFFSTQPVASSNSDAPNAFDTSDARSCFLAQQARIGCFICDTSHGSKP
jgi:hypothetical protein